MFITGSVPEIEQDGYFMANAFVQLEINDRFALQAGVISLFHKDYLIQGNVSLGTLGYAEKIYARPQGWGRSMFRQKADFSTAATPSNGNGLEMLEVIALWSGLPKGSKASGSLAAKAFWGWQCGSPLRVSIQR